jgi:transposase InsO family protein
MTYRYRFISTHRAVYGVKRLCRVLAVRRQGFYEWLAAAAGREQRDAAEDALAAQIAGIHAEHRGAYGSPRMTVELRRRGQRVNRKRVERIMRQRGVVGITRRRRRSLTSPDQTAAPAPDLIGRELTAPAPGLGFVGDITYLPTVEGWLYLASVIDLHTREVVGHAMAEHMRAELVCDAVGLAGRRGLVEPDAVYHSDRGVQYTSAEFRTTLKRLQVRPSTGRVGSCYDNAVAESFFAVLKTEIGTRVWATRAEARKAVFGFISYYNQNRLHSTLNYRTPYEVRVCYRQDHALAA